MPTAGFPFELLFTMKGDLTPLTDLEKKTDQLGMRLRLTGRDLMRLGGTMDKFFSRFLAAANTALMGSLLWEAGLEDIRWALEDVGSILGDILSPILELIVRLIENFADALATSPILQWIVIIGLAGLMIGKLISYLLSAVGTLNLYIGTLLIAHRAHLGLGTSLKSLIIGYTQGTEALKAYIQQQKGLLNPLNKLQDIESKTSVQQKRLVTGLYDMEEATSAAVPGTSIKRAGGLGAKFKGLFKSVGIGKKAFLGLATGAASLGFLFFVLAGQSEPLQELFQVIGEILQPILDLLAPIIENIIAWVEQNPELALGLLSVAGALALILPHLPGILAFLGFAPTVGGLGAAFAGLGTAISGAGASLLAFLATNPVGWILLAIGAIIAIITYMGWWDEIWQGLCAVGQWFADIFSGIASFLVSTFGPIFVKVGEIFRKIWDILQSVGNVFYQVGRVIYAIFYVIIQKVIQALTWLWENVFVPFGNFLATVFKPVIDYFAPTFAEIAKALGIVWAALQGVFGGIQSVVMPILNAFLDALNWLKGAIDAVGSFLGGLADALMKLCFRHATPWAEEFTDALKAQLPLLDRTSRAVNALGGTLLGLGGGIIPIAAGVPAFQRGGVVTEGGLAFLHAGERVVPGGALTGVTYYNTFYVTATVREEADIEKLAKEINRLQGTEIGRTR